MYPEHTGRNGGGRLEVGIQQYEREMREFYDVMMRFSGENRNLDTIDGLSNLAATIQRRLHIPSTDKFGKLSSKIKNSGLSYLASIPTTMLDRDEINTNYEMENINAWLSNKNLEVVRGGNTPSEIKWSRGKGFDRGIRERDYYFRDKKITVGALAVMSRFLGDNLYARMENFGYYTSEDINVLMLSAVTSYAIEGELSHLVETGNSLPPDFVRELIQEPLSHLDLRLLSKH